MRASNVQDEIAKYEEKIAWDVSALKRSVVHIILVSGHCEKASLEIGGRHKAEICGQTAFT